jgi:photosynthetic reaction center cytochrome c subunit
MIAMSHSRSGLAPLRLLRSTWVLAVAGSALLLGGCWERPPVDSEQIGFRGVAMQKVDNPRREAEKIAANVAPEAPPAAPAEGPKAGDIYQNVQVLGDLSVGQFTRLMAYITQWVSPEQGCAYCHEGANFASDALYTKMVARRMLQMTSHINNDWGDHVGGAGVNCYTCHRGMPVPANIWFETEGPPQAQGMVGYRADQNVAAKSVGSTSLPYDPFTPYLLGDQEIRGASGTALPEGNKASIKNTELTYALMIHMSNSLGVNCTYCHNSRAFYSWEQSHPTRATAWYGIRMVRSLNNEYLVPLGPTYPENRLGDLGDAPKANCTTCHQGVYKPLYGVDMIGDYPELTVASP